MHLPPPWYFVVGVIIGLIVLLICLCSSSEEDRYIKAKQLAIWAIVFILSSILWPVILAFGLLILMGNM